LAGCIFLAAGLGSRAQEAGSKEEGHEALLAAARAYRAVRTYSDVTKISILLRSQAVKQDRAMVFRVALERPNKLSVRLESGPAATTIVSNGQRLWTYYGAIQKYAEKEAPPHFEEALSPYQLGAASEEAPNRLEPFELFRELLSAGGEEAAREWKVAKLESTDASLIHLSVEGPPEKGSVQVWLGKGDHRLRRLTADITELVKSQFDEAMASELKDLKAEMTEEHEEIRVDEKLDESLFVFAPPEGAEKLEPSELGGLTGSPAGRRGSYTLRWDPVETIPPRELKIGEPARGVFEDGGSGEGGEAKAAKELPYDLWTLEAEKKGTLRILLDSEESDPVLYLLGTPDDLLEDALSADDDGGQGANAVLFVEAEAGRKYFLAAARKVGSAPGAYSLRAQWHVPVTTPKLRSIEMKETREGSLSWDSAERLNHVHLDAWTLKAPEGKLVTVEVHSEDFVPALRVYREGTKRAITRNDEPSAEGKENVARIFFRAERGASYRMEVAGLDPGELGRYKVTLEAGELPDPEASFSIRPLEAGKASEGKLTDEMPQGIWKVTVEKGTRAVLRARSGGFFPALSLRSYHPSTPPLFRVDAGGESAALVVDLFPGIPYFITVDSEN
jgi:outer membrane lipoprotein-sorting protein